MAMSTTHRNVEEIRHELRTLSEILTMTSGSLAKSATKLRMLAVSMELQEALQ